MASIAPLRRDGDSQAVSGWRIPGDFPITTRLPR